MAIDYDLPSSTSASLSVRHLQRVLVAATILIVALGIIRLFAVNTFGFDHRDPFVRWLDLDGEASLPAWFSSLLLAGSSVIAFASAGMAARESSVWRWHWYALSFILLLMSADEAISIHETLRQLFLPGDYVFEGIFHFDWVVIGLPLVAAVGLLYVPFVLGLPRRTAVDLIVAGAVYFGGSLGFEMLNGAVGHHGRDLWNLIMVIEESLEMAGLILLLRVLMTHLVVEQRWPGFALRP